MWLTIIKDIVIIATGVVASIVAIIGLNTWRKQIRGTSEYELAKKILKQIYQFRQAIEFVRFPLFSTEETELSEENYSATRNKREERFGKLSNAYQSRYAKVNEARVAIEATLLEVEVLWGKHLLPKIRKLYELDGELYGTIMEHLETVVSDAVQSRQTTEDRKRIFDTIISRRNKEKDEYYQRLQSAIDDIAKEIKPHLKRFGS